MIRLKPWTAGHRAKFLIDAEGGFHHWQTDANGAPDHGQVAEHLGIRSAIDGIVESDGGWWVSAREPPADHARLIEHRRTRRRSGVETSRESRARAAR
jgi:hypothetical protein